MRIGKSRASGILFGVVLSLAMGSTALASAPPRAATPPSPVPPASSTTSDESVTLAPATSSAAAVTPSANPVVAAVEAAPKPATEPVAVSAPAVPATGCTGTGQFQRLFADAARDLLFPVKCAVLPSDWWVQQAVYQLPKGGMLVANYTNGRKFMLTLLEGNLCVDREFGSPANVAPSSRKLLGCDWTELASVKNKIWVADLGAYLVVIPMIQSFIPVWPTQKLTQDTKGLFMAIAPVSPYRTYILEGFGMSLGTFKKLAKAMITVPKP